MHAVRIAIAAAALAAAPVFAQAAMPGSPEVSRLVAGTYKVDTGHTQVIWTVEHLGISPLSGAFRASGGSLKIDPAKPSAAKVSVTFNVVELSTTSAAFAKHLASAELFDAAQYATASFVSTAVAVSGAEAKVSGNLTLKGVTKPVTLTMKFHGAGINPNSKKLQAGFTGSAMIKRSDFGLGYAVPRVGDDVRLEVTGVFEQVS